MPRHARLKVAGQPLHVIQRGVNRARCFGADNDYLLYLSLLEEIAPRYDCSIHSYVLMTNHVHLLLTPEHADGISSLMKHLGQRYVQRFNRGNKRTGTLWEGRFRSCLIDSEAYLLRCQVYIELNPVRAGMVRHPQDYRWSSYGASADGKSSRIVTPHRLYLSLGKDEEERLSTYQTLFNGALSEDALKEIREAVNSGRVLGSRSYIAEMEQRLKRRVAHGAAGRPRKKRLADDCSARREIGVCPRFI